MNLTTEKSWSTNNIRIGFVLVVLMTIAFFFSFATYSHAITINCPDEVYSNSATTCTASGCDGSVSWSVTGTGASISSNGLLTIGSASCGGITVAASCSDGSIATKTARVTNAGQWVALLIGGGYSGACGASYEGLFCCCNCGTVPSAIRGKYYLESISITFSCGPTRWILDHRNNPFTDISGSAVGCNAMAAYGFGDLRSSGSGGIVSKIWVHDSGPYCRYTDVQVTGRALPRMYGAFRIYEWKCPSCTNGQTISCYTGTGGTQGVGVCKAGTQTCTGGQWGACQGEVTPVAEICGDGKDNNCNGEVDEGCTVCEDKDGDGYYAISANCPQGDDCNDNDATVYFGAPEICNGKDNDCNGLLDDIPEICYTGPLGTQGVGICKTGTHVCENGTYSVCIGEVTPQEDVCDGLDNNCDGSIDEGCEQCPITPLTPLTDPLTIRMENGETVIYDGLTTEMLQSVNCFSDEVFNAGGTLTITSAYRPQQYQQHLREVWDKHDILENTSNPACDQLKSEIRAEFQRHRLRYRPAGTSRHTMGTAIDASWNLPTGQSIDALANRCVLSRPVPNDPIHFELRR